MRTDDRQALVEQLAADFPLFPRPTIERWVEREARGTADPARVGLAVRATLEELSREGVTTSRELPLQGPAADVAS